MLEKELSVGEHSGWYKCESFSKNKTNAKTQCFSATVVSAAQSCLCVASMIKCEIV
jgi:hypothetical protein